MPQPFSKPEEAAAPSGGRYRVAGLAILSEVTLYGAQSAAQEPTEAPVRIVLSGEIILDQPEPGRGGSWQIAPQQFLFDVPGVSRFRVTSGALIEVAPYQGADPAKISACVLGTCMAAILYQQGAHVLHGSAVQVGGSAVLFCGASGAGKSTLAAVLQQSGYPLLCEDFCTVQKQEGQLVILPDARSLKLCPDAVDALDAHHEILAPIDSDRQKYFVQRTTSSASHLPIRAVYLLQEDAAASVAIVPTDTVSALAELRRNCYRPVLMAKMGMERSYFAVAGQLCEQAAVSRLVRRKNFAEIADVVATLQRHWRRLHLLPPSISDGLVVLLTGLSGAGKTTLANHLCSELKSLSIPVDLLDGDQVRAQDRTPLGFTREDRERNIRRLADIGKQRLAPGKVVLIAAIAPFTSSRDHLRSRFPDLLEVHVDAPLSVCELRDPKGLYRRARAREIRNFTGIDSPYEKPQSPDVHCPTGAESVAQSSQRILAAILKRVAHSQ